MAGKDITVKGSDGAFGAYLASPASSHGPGIIVIQEIFGVNDVVRAICDAHAARGRFALAPDLFWRLEPGVKRTDSDVNVGYYGVMLENRLNEAGKIKKPLMLHIAGKDAYQKPEARAQIMD